MVLAVAVVMVHEEVGDGDGGDGSAALTPQPVHRQRCGGDIYVKYTERFPKTRMKVIASAGHNLASPT